MLGDDMGLGKTATAILAADMIGATSVVVVCPASVRAVWRSEIARFSTLQPNALIFSYNELVSNPDKKLLAIGHQPEVLILDEAHFLKSPWSKRTGVCYETLINHADVTWGLTGTPAPKDPSDLWTHCKYLGGETADFVTWAEHFCHLGPSEYAPGFRVFGLKRDRIPELRARLAPWYLRRRLEDVALDLPPLRWGELPVESEGAIRSLKKYLSNHTEESEGLARLERIVRTGSDEEVLEALERSPYTATIQRLTALAKLPALLEEIDRQMEDGLEKVVLFAHHREVIHEIENHFGDLAVSLHGGTPDHKRLDAVNRFQDREDVRVFVGQSTAAGTGLTLTAADRAIFVESSWVPAVMSQAAKRIHRIGQDKSCLVQVASLIGSFDETVNRVLTRRAQAINELEEQR